VGNGHSPQAKLTHTVTNSPVSLILACRRYETVWLPMLASAAAAGVAHTLIPPLGALGCVSLTVLLTLHHD
jgi:hypothetical protein